MNRTAPDAQGYLGAVTFSTVTACLICGNNCAVRVDGFPLHLPCWQMTAAADRQQWTPPATQPSSPAIPPAPPSRKGTPLGQRAAVQPRKAAVAEEGQAVPIAAVVDVESTWTTDDRQVPTPQITHLGELVQFAHSLGLGMMVSPTRPAIGQVWVTAAAAAAWGMDLGSLAQTGGEKLDEPTRQLTAGSDFVAQAAAQGWCTSGSGEGTSLGRWTRVWHRDEHDRTAVVWVVLVPAVTGPGEPLTDGDPSAQELAQRIGKFAAALQFPYRMSPTATGLDLMTMRRRGHEGAFAPSDPIPPAQIATLERDFNWTRKPTDEEATHKFVHAYDRSGSYLAAAAVDLGVGSPQHHPTGVDFDPKVVGYWRVEIPETGDWRVPHPLNPNGRASDEPTWVTTPSLAIAYEMGLEAEVIEAWTWTDKARLLEPWYERIRDARALLITQSQRDEQASMALGALKAVYTRTIGMMGSSTHLRGQEGYAPERRHMIIGRANANILRRVRQIGETTGRWPLAIQTDTLLYSSDEEDPAKAWPLAQAPEAKQWWGSGLGEYKHEATGLLADQLEYLTGGRWEGKDALLGRER